MALPFRYNIRNIFVLWRATLATVLGVALVGGELGCLLAWPMHGYSTGIISWESFAQTVLQFRITPWLAAKGLVFSIVVGLASAGHRGIAGSLKQAKTGSILL